MAMNLSGTKASSRHAGSVLATIVASALIVRSQSRARAR
jgi:hypothetical protein